jgi:thiazole synthase ThiGH ThiG subunit
MIAEKVGTDQDRVSKPSDNAAKLRAVTLAIARTPVKFREGRVIEMYRRMAICVLDNTKGANDLTDTWSKAYDEMIQRDAHETEAAKRYR